MAANQTTKKPKTKQATKAAAKGRGRQSAAPVVEERQSYHREICGGLFLVLAFFSALCCFGSRAIFLDLLTALFTALVGYTGMYILPFVFLICGIVLLLHGGRPVRMRIACAFGIVLSLSAIVHLISYRSGFSWNAHIVAQLFRAGKSGNASGVLGGLIAMTLERLFGVIGAFFILSVALLLEMLTTLNLTMRSILKAIKNRPRSPYEQEKSAYQPPAEKIVNHVARKHIERVERRRVSEFDLPVDDPPAAQEHPQPKRKSPMSPDEYILQERKKRERTPSAQELVQQEIDMQRDAAVSVPQDVPLPENQEQEPQMQPTQPMPPEEPLQEQQTEQPLPVEALPKLEKEKKPAVVKKADAIESAEQIAQEIAEKEAPVQEYVYPPVSLLHLGAKSGTDGTAEMRENSKRLSDTLESFGIEPHIVNVTRGPSVTRYEIELDRGVKLAKLTNLSEDIALALGAAGVRISAIPDKISVVGIEVPNKAVTTVYAREVIDSPAFYQSKSRVTFAVGKDISGNCIVEDISKLPHMLIAGTTGSGKSVCMNTLIISLLYKAKPDEVRLIMVDPKMVELGCYNGIPHLLIPVVTDPKKAAGALQWTVTEMMRRYRLMSEIGVRDMESYNKVVAADPDQKPMEKIVVVIDELADLMLVAAKEVEESICRIAQMGRASGIHLIIATQRPSADVITGLMKANIPSRIAFAVASAMESRIILDTHGAEKLVGKGDMLFAPLGKGKPKRIQGCFITDEEVLSVIDFIKKESTAQYSTEIMEQIEKRAEQGGKQDNAAQGAQEPEEEGDELFPAAVEVILEIGQASVSMLQRRLKLGYARAARIIDEMEDKGIVGPYEGSKPRQLLITREQWQQMQNGTGEATEEENLPVEEEIP